MIIISGELEKFFRTWGYQFETSISYKSNGVSYVLTLIRCINPDTRVSEHHFKIGGRDIILTKNFIKFVLDNYFQEAIPKLFPKVAHTDILNVSMYGGLTSKNLYNYYYNYSLR